MVWNFLIEMNESHYKHSKIKPRYWLTQGEIETRTLSPPASSRAPPATSTGNKNNTHAHALSALPCSICASDSLVHTQGVPALWTSMT